MQNLKKNKINKVLLIILDGFGLRSEDKDNAVKLANMPNWDYYSGKFAFGKIEASGKAVGLPKDQFGNSEVGHLNIGAGRVVKQDITRIDDDIEDGTFVNNSVLKELLTKSVGHNLHILGLLSDGGVHSHINHILELIKASSSYAGIKTVWIHVFLDGRDTPPKSAIKYLKQLNDYIRNYSNVKIATISGRYYAMDRDRRYDRILKSYLAIVYAKSEFKEDSATIALEKSYANGHNDEFVEPTIISGYPGFEDMDSFVFANFRSDRAVQLTDALVNNPDYLKNKTLQIGMFASMTRYADEFVGKVQELYPPVSIVNTLGEVLSKAGLAQLRVAETEKYPHVTYFLNGGRHEPYAGEERILVNSPRDVATYDLKPEMSLPEVVKNIVESIKNDTHDVIITNFANGDMVGHTGVLGAAIKAVESIDKALGEVIHAMQEAGGEVIIIADHGNCEQMYDEIHKQPHTQHTTNLVPFLYVGRSASIKPNGALKDVAPTLLDILDISQPKEMTGNSLIEFTQ